MPARTTTDKRKERKRRTNQLGWRPASKEKQAQVKVETNERGDLVIDAPYHRWLVAGLKAEISAGAREYNKTTKTWTIEKASAGKALDILRAIFPGAPITHTNTLHPH